MTDAGNNCPIGAEPWSTCPENRDDCCAAVCPYYHPDKTP